jgi:hypothetical protein
MLSDSGGMVLATNGFTSVRGALILSAPQLHQVTLGFSLPSLIGAVLKARRILGLPEAAEKSLLTN